MKHLEVAHTVVDFLHKSFPDASIALGGSVAEFFFRKDSDLDILFMKASITGAYLVNMMDWRLPYLLFQNNIYIEIFKSIYMDIIICL